jgi:hypothetical protein
MRRNPCHVIRQALLLSGRYLAEVAARVIAVTCRPRRERAKVLVVDLEKPR